MPKDNPGTLSGQVYWFIVNWTDGKKELRKHDSKYNTFRNEISSYLGEHPKEKIVVFAFFRATLDYLHERLSSDGIQSIVLKGGMKTNKQDILARFRNPDGPSVLLSSEVGSEGIDLQFSRVVVNYDLPWNPMKVEQRIGRIDRLGQDAEKISIWNLYYANTIDSRIYEKLYARIGLFESALGGLEPIIGEEMKSLTSDLLSSHLSPVQEEQRIDQTAVALENRLREEEHLEKDASHLVAYSDYIVKEVNAAKQMQQWITAEDLFVYVSDFLTTYYPGCELKKVPDSTNYKVRLSTRAKLDLGEFCRRNHVRFATRLTQDGSGAVVCRFSSKVDSHDRTIEFIDQFHPLVRFASNSLDKDSEISFPVSAVSIQGGAFKPEINSEIYLYAVQKWTVSGIQDSERLHFGTLCLSTKILSEPEFAEKLIRTASLEGREWFEANAELNLKNAAKLTFDVLLGSVDDTRDDFFRDIQDSNEDRAQLQKKTLEQHFSKQEARHLTLEEAHQAAGRKGLANAEKAKLRKLEAKVDRKRMEIEDRRIPKTDYENISIGVIKVT